MMLSAKRALLGFLFLPLFLAGCATPEKIAEKGPAVFFPDPPSPPRIQYLRSYTHSQDIETAKSKFDQFITGEQELILRLDKPFGVALYDGKIYVCDTNNLVMIFDLNSKKFRTMEGAKGLGRPLQPMNISIDADGTKYVSDPVRGQVLVYDARDAFVKAIGAPQEWTPIDAAPFGDWLYVVDKKENVIWVLEKSTGTLTKKIGNTDEDQTKWLNRPTNLAFSGDGYLYVSDAARFQIVKFDRDGHFIATIGSLGASPGRFSRPRGVATDRDGRLYAVDAAFDNVQMFNKDGRLLLFFGRPGNKPGDLYLPAKVFIDYDHVNYFSDYIDPNFQAEALLIVTNQFGPRLVNIFALGKQKGVKYPEEEAVLKQLEEQKKVIQEREKEKEQKKEAEEEKKKEAEEEKKK